MNLKGGDNEDLIVQITSSASITSDGMLASSIIFFPMARRVLCLVSSFYSTSIMFDLMTTSVNLKRI